MRIRALWILSESLLSGSSGSFPNTFLLLFLCGSAAAASSSSVHILSSLQFCCFFKFFSSFFLADFAAPSSRPLLRSRAVVFSDIRERRRIRGHYCHRSFCCCQHTGDCLLTVRFAVERTRLLQPEDPDRRIQRGSCSLCRDPDGSETPIRSRST